MPAEAGVTRMLRFKGCRRLGRHPGSGVLTLEVRLVHWCPRPLPPRGPMALGSPAMATTADADRSSSPGPSIHPKLPPPSPDV